MDLKIVDIYRYEPEWSLYLRQTVVGRFIRNVVCAIIGDREVTMTYSTKDQLFTFTLFHWKEQSFSFNRDRLDLINSLLSKEPQGGSLSYSINKQTSFWLSVGRPYIVVPRWAENHVKAAFIAAGRFHPSPFQTDDSYAQYQH